MARHPTRTPTTTTKARTPQHTPSGKSERRLSPQLPETRPFPQLKASRKARARTPQDAPGRPRTGARGRGLVALLFTAPKSHQNGPRWGWRGNQTVPPPPVSISRTRCYAGHSKRCVAPVMQGVKTGQGQGGWKSPGRGFSPCRNTGGKVSIRDRGAIGGRQSPGRQSPRAAPAPHARMRDFK